MNVVRWIKKRPVHVALAAWFFTAWSWTLVTDSLELAGSKTQGVILAIIITFINVSISTFIVLRFIKIANFVLDRYRWQTAVALSLMLFAVMDFLVAWVPAILWIGPEGRIDSVLPLSSPALIIINTPLGFASRIVGFYGLAAFIWLTIHLALTKKIRHLSAIPALLLISLSLVGYIAYKDTDGQEIKAIVVTETLSNRIPAIDPSGVDLVIFPEYGLDGIDNSNLGNRIVTNTQSPKRHFFIGSEQVVPEDRVGHYNRFVSGNTNEGITHRQDKYRMIPGGEDLPYILRVGLRATGQKTTLDYFSYSKGTLKGDRQLSLVDIEKATLGSAVCSSIISPSDYRHFASSGADLFTNSASLSIFQGSSVFSFQQKSLARFMAIANSRYFLQSANAAKAYSMDNNGNTLTQISGHGSKETTVKTNSTKTIYTLAGELMVVFGFITLAWVIWIKIRQNKKPKRKSNKTKK